MAINVCNGLLHEWQYVWCVEVIWYAIFFVDGITSSESSCLFCATIDWVLNLIVKVGWE